MTFVDEMFDVLRRRTSCRDFQRGRELEPEKLWRIVNSVECGPSAGNLRAYAVHRVEGAETKEKLCGLALGQRQVADASVVFVVCAVPSKSMAKYGQRGELYAIQDATIAGMNVTYAATALGLGSCWIGSIFTGNVVNLLGLDKDEIPISLICVGYPMKSEEAA